MSKVFVSLETAPKPFMGMKVARSKQQNQNKEEHPTQQLHVSLELETERAAVEIEGWESSKCVKAVCSPGWRETLELRGKYNFRKCFSCSLGLQ